MQYADFFRLATGLHPYPYQLALAKSPWPDTINIPTGIGKTAGVVIAWLYKRHLHDAGTPRRLAYCLPMRVLVEQTAENAKKWIDSLQSAGIIATDRKPNVHILMGGDVDNDWDLYPERDAILVGTQEQLLSRALNRGYAVSRFRWPVHFGLLNNDCLWVMDEVQLMGSGIATTAQLQAFRLRFGSVIQTKSVWMSATLDKGWLRTVDFAGHCAALEEISLSDADKAFPGVAERVNARKLISEAECVWDDFSGIAKLVLDAHRKKRRTLVIVNTVRRAVQIYQALKKKKGTALLVLVHSQFRPKDRQDALRRLLAEPGPEGTICVATQVVEAGVDVSATTLLTDLAPWASLVQRFGRCNRYGADTDARIHWLAPPRDGAGMIKDKTVLPYVAAELELAAKQLGKLKNAAPSELASPPLRPPYTHVIRARDIVDLFDTTPDLAGMDIDISRFIREAEDHDVQVFWRDVDEKANPGPDEKPPAKNELCPVPVGQVRLLKNISRWTWDYLEKEWVRPTSLAPGMTLMVRRSDGLYSKEIGWTGSTKDIPEIVIPLDDVMPEAYDSDNDTSVGWQSLIGHNDAVSLEMDKLVPALGIPADKSAVLHLAGRWHDAGKSHEVFRNAVVAGSPPDSDPAIIWGKAGIQQKLTYARRGFRHELAAALAMLANGLPDLAAYLVAAHHGKVRLSIRSFPHEQPPPNAATRFARGIWDGDMLPEVDLGNGVVMPQTPLDLSYMEFGDGPNGPSWTSRVLALRDQIGVFGLAYLEAILRVSDWRASRKKEVTP